MERDKSLIRYIVGASRIKYEVLDDLIKGHKDLVGVNFQNNFRMAVMLIDAHSIFYRLYREKDLTAIYADSEDELVCDLVVGFMNAIGHYRRYLATRLHLDNDIFISFNMDPCKYQRSLVPDYGDKYVQRYAKDNPTYKFINKALRKAWKFIVGLSVYFEGIYCIDMPGVDDFTTLLRAVPMSDHNLYINFTRNPIPLQLLSNSTNELPNWFQLIGKRDNSIFVDKNDCIERVIMAERRLKASPYIGPGDLPYLWAVGGCQYVSMGQTKYARSIGEAIRMTNRLIEETGVHALYTLTLSQYCEGLAQLSKKSAIELKSLFPKIEKRFKAVNLYLSTGAVSNDQWMAIKAHIVDMFDQTELEKLNDMLVQMGGADPNILEIDNLNMSECQ
ncbi:MAG: hypothetical protein NC489_08015 [Ruminococcus flavefaciens]|nr:hypothetical protein [Ruminococcus flavefaciens]